MKIYNFYIIFLFLFSPFVHASNQAVIGERLAIEGYELEKQGKFDQALAKYQESLNPQYNKARWEEGSGRSGIRRLYIKWGKYEKAREATKWFLESKKELKNPTKELVWEVDALIEYQKTGNPQKILEHIEYLKKQYAVSLPPKPWNGGTPTITGKLFRFYNLIGDHNSGIKLIDESFKVFREYDMKKYGKPKLGRTDAAYQSVRDGFERDKVEGFKGCAQSPPGVVCMGHATYAMIQSREFSW